MDTSLVTIMMPAYNVAAFIEESIKSVINQSYHNWELIIVDDGSVDQTANVVSQFSDSRIRFFQQENGGEASARNRALDIARGQYLAFLDADDKYYPDHLQAIVEHFQKHPMNDGVYTDGYFINHRGQQLDTLSSRRRGPFSGDIFEEIVRSSDVFGPPICVALDNKRIANLELQFDEDLTIGPDWDFMTRYAENATFGYVDRTTCLYRVHQSNITVTAGSGKRNADLALCRQKAVKLGRFGECSVETRFAVFYDLLVVLLLGFPELQTEIIEGPEFSELPSNLRARLLRLMASKIIADGGKGEYLEEWLRLSSELNPRDLRGRLLNRAYRSSPDVCRFALRVKNLSVKQEFGESPLDALALE